MDTKALISRHQPAGKIEIPFGFADIQELILRPGTVSDAPGIVKAINQSLPELRRFLPWAHHEQTEEKQIIRLADCYKNYWSGVDQTLLITTNTNEVIGSTGLHACALNPMALKIGYWIATPFVGKGIATAVAKALVVYGFEYLKLQRIQCAHNSANHGSGRVMKKCGFITEGALKKFEASPTEEQKKNGAIEGESMIFTALLIEDTLQLPWYDDVRSSLRVYDYRNLKC